MWFGDKVDKRTRDRDSGGIAGESLEEGEGRAERRIQGLQAGKGLGGE